MSDLRDLYQEVILDHSRRPRNFGPTGSATSSARGDNPLCGDKVTVYVQVEAGTVRDVRFEGKGCAISTASASLMTESVRGKTLAEADALFHRFHGVVTAPPDAEIDLDALGKLAALAGVREYPMRVKCASLAWHTLKAALHGKSDPVSTE
jgi:nitrogen fixation protein NifU and related proteins